MENQLLKNKELADRLSTLGGADSGTAALLNIAAYVNHKGMSLQDAFEAAAKDIVIAAEKSSLRTSVDFSGIDLTPEETSVVDYLVNVYLDAKSDDDAFETFRNKAVNGFNLSAYARNQGLDLLTGESEFNGLNDDFDAKEGDIIISYVGGSNIWHIA